MLKRNTSAEVALSGAGLGVGRKSQLHKLGSRVNFYKGVYFLMIPGFLYLLIFKYLPMAGIYIAFTDFSPRRGIYGSEFVGFKHFVRLFSHGDILGKLLRNTFTISGMRLLVGFPIPIILALLLNEMNGQRLKKTFQTMIYFPHFISMVVLASITMTILSPTDGVVNYAIVALGGEPISFITEQDYFRWIIVFQGIWKSAGWGTIIYLAALSGVDPNLYEAADMDGVGRWGKMWHISLPAISDTIIILLILNVGKLINENFQQIFLMLTPFTYEVGDVFETYVYRLGIVGNQVSYAAAIGLFKSIVAMVMIIGANKVARRFGSSGVY